MIGFIHQLWQIPNQFRKAFLTPAKDPRVVYGPAHQSREAYSEKGRTRARQGTDKAREGICQLDVRNRANGVAGPGEELEQLQPLLARRKNSDPLTIAQVPALAQETYRQGMSILVDPWTWPGRWTHLGVGKLQSEATKLESEMESMGGDEN